MEQQTMIKVFISNQDSTCDECHEQLGRGTWITLVEDRKALCLACADLDHLIFLPSGNAALTRRANKSSALSAVVLKWSRNRKRYERQGILVEEAALEQAEQQCLADADLRARRAERDAERRAELDAAYIESFAERVRELYPNCPPDREHTIAKHACRKYSGRVGRSAAAKNLDNEAIHLAVTAHARHAETPYDTLLATGLPRLVARDEIKDKLNTTLANWS